MNMNHAQPRRIRLILLAFATCVGLASTARSADQKKDLLKPVDPNAKPVQHPRSSIAFKKIVLSKDFYGEGAAIGDFNHDGKMDVVSGPFWYEGPDFKPEKRHAYYPPAAKPFDTHKYSDNFFAFTYDFNGDGWDDILIYGFPGTDASWYENPKDPTSDKPWTRHKVLDVVDNESPGFVDINGDGKPDILCTQGGYIGYATADWKDPARPWTFHKISAKGGWAKFTHGLGSGDVNGDGKTDILLHEGWWEQPAKLEGDAEWKFHKADFGPGGAQMHVYDVNGDGRNDVITSLQAHGYGLAWFEQKADGSFEKHLIMGQKPEENAQGAVFTQLHAVDVVDIDGDGLKDIVTGKRFYAHAGGDAEWDNPNVPLYWFKLVRKDGGKVEWIANEIDNDSGVGTQVTVGDVNGDKHPDIVVGNKKGTFVFIQQPKQQARGDAK